jgi:DNA-binding MarR family transcriptional regulator
VIDDDLRSTWLRLDLAEQPLVTYDESRRWSPDTLDRLLAWGLLRKVSVADAVPCDSCDEGHMLTPDLRDHPLTGELMAIAKCPECGRIEIELARLQQWEIAADGLATQLATSLGMTRQPVEDGSRRIWFLGTVQRDGRFLDIFLARGLTRPNATRVIDAAGRFQASRQPVVIVPYWLPPIGFWRRSVAATAALSEIAAAGEVGIDIRWEQVLDAVEDQGPYITEDARGATSTAELSPLTETEFDVLQALASSANKTMLLIDITTVAGYGKSATQAALKRLRSLGLVAKPAGMQRKGDAITAEGRAFLDRHRCVTASPGGLRRA